MSIIDSIKNIFEGEKKEPLSWEDTAPSEYEPPDEWFNPLDKMPIANGSNKYAPTERLAELEAETNPRPEEEIADWFNDKVIENPDESDEIEEEKTMHQKMYEIATAKYNPFSVSGSDNFQGGAENRT